ncbi:E3 ubiquitin-protein ligase Midline-1-like [Mytilus edulis]|uniref:E3 ubiquitin-protein ligase Midline-1-like n=1 Tax=Mytilus edulis TaxID=6550 RepID=UPI0039EE8D6D
MAFSESMGTAQTPALCQFCEESPEIKWKCINCELFLCQLCCSKIHSKIKTSQEHEMINLKDFKEKDFATSVRKVNLENMGCTIHEKQKCFVFCKDCSEPACSTCLMETHKLHDYKALDEVYQDLLSEMKKQIKQIEIYLELFKYKKDKLQKMISDGNIYFQEARDAILKTEKEMKDSIAKHAKDLLQELEAKWKPSENMIKEEISDVIKSEMDMENRKDNINKSLQSHKAEDIFNTSKNLDKPFPKYSAMQMKSNRTVFCPSNIQVKLERASLFGELFTRPNIELMDTYESELVSVKSLVLGRDQNTAFISSPSSQKLQKVRFENHTIKVEREIQMYVIDIAKTKDGGILIADGYNNLKLYTKDGQVETFKSFSPLKTLSVHVTKDNQIIIGLVEIYPVTLPAPKGSTRKLIVMNQNGDIQHTIEHDKNNQRMLTYPHRIRSLDDKIVVVDLINSEWEGRVVKLNYGGQLHWTYKGWYHITPYDQLVKFQPESVTITSKDMILVAECFHNAIHVLTSAGEVILWKDVNSLGVEFPLSLEIDKNDFLWIGCATYTDKIRRAKISCVQLT